MDEAEGWMSVKCGGLVLPRHNCGANGADRGLVRGTLHVHVAYVTMFVNLDVACGFPMPSGNRGPDCVDCLRLCEPAVVIILGKHWLYTRHLKNALTHTRAGFQRVNRDFHFVYVAADRGQLSSHCLSTKRLQIIEHNQRRVVITASDRSALFLNEKHESERIGFPLRIDVALRQLEYRQLAELRIRRVPIRFVKIASIIAR